MSDQLLRWCVDQLNHTFGLEASDDIVEYMLSIDNGEELAEYVGDLVQGNDGKKKQFIDELLARWQRARCLVPEGAGLLLGRETSAEMQDVAKDLLKKTKRKGRNRQELLTVSEPEPAPEVVKTPIDLLKVQENSSVKKKNKFVNLYTKDGQEKLTILLPGRHACECLAQKHCLVNNCMTCGRIVCEQEGSGPCLFCGALVCTKEEQKILERDSNKSQKLRKKLMNDHARQSDLLPHEEERIKAGLEKALQHKDKLLEFDTNSVRRTQVLDDESDYFSTDSNQWLSTGEREALRKREAELGELRHASRKDRKITLDFAGRQVLEEGDNLSQYYSRFDEAVQAINTGTLVTSSQRTDNPPPRELVNPTILQAAPQWVDMGSRAARQKPQERAVCSEAGPGRARLRLQDRELQEMSDGGWCLSMHQPWASLLVLGIKRVEGRSWYSSHRGRLWIAAAAKKPSPQEISQVESQYRQLYRTELQFPKQYPTGCLLGCVNMTDCLSQEQYRDQFPNSCEESSSPFVFICSQPQELFIKFSMKGKHKIWKMDSQNHQGARKGLKPSPILCA
ncbi:activating signal cointegrator 1 [Conger conger]|uniref:activating signal cointegrator 1 n=1 Tax=Conger conger TaxID=82655 RepID=UPI002A5ABB11|nr:activating signal cointegrator 1 [Conger conger]